MTMTHGALVDLSGDVSSPLLTSEEAAQFLRRDPRTLAAWRACGTGPPYVRFRGRVHYRVADLHAWLDRQIARPDMEHAS